MKNVDSINKDKKRPPAWLSTHPPTQKRIDEIKKLLSKSINIFSLELLPRSKGLNEKGYNNKKEPIEFGYTLFMGSRVEIYIENN